MSKVKIRSFKLKTLGLYHLVKNKPFTKKFLRKLIPNENDLNRFLQALIEARLIEEIKDIENNVVAYRFTEKIKEFENNI